MIGAEIMRDVAVLGAECHVGAPSDRVTAADCGWDAQPDARAALLERMVEHEGSDDPARVRLCDELGVDANAYWLAMLCAAAELHPEAAAAISLLAEDAHMLLPTPTVVARLLRGVRGVPFATALAGALDGGAAERVGVVEVVEPAPGLPHAHHALRMVREELVAALADPAALGARRALVALAVPPSDRPAFDEGLVRRAVVLLERRGVLVLRGPSRRASRQMACDVATQLGLVAHLATPRHALPEVSELARVRDGLPTLDLHALGEQAAPGGEAAHGARTPHDELSRLARALGRLVLVVDESADTGELAALDVGTLGGREARRVWSELLPAEEAERMAVRFRVSIEEARGALREAHDLHGDDVGPDELAERVRALGGRRMGRHVTVLEPYHRPSELVVTPELRRQLDEIAGWHRATHRVRYEMGTTARDPLGRGLTCLFAGKSGTGKTFAARCLAAELGLNVYRVDLSQVVSKYIGDTEKALARVFDEVEAGHGLLLFDEADALFGRRSEVKDAHDRYANVEVGYLLQKMDSYEGIAILTTNLQGNMDAAFVRRLRFVLHFPSPDRELRRRLWDRSLPGAAWRADDLELEVLADRFQLTGGAIHNIGLAAAHLAAATPSGRVTAAHVVRATQRELQKTGRPADANAFGPLAPLLNGAGDGGAASAAVGGEAR